MAKRNIPVNGKGDPAFESVEHILTVFTPAEVTEIVNRYCYQAGFNRDYHKHDQKRRLAKQKLINAVLRSRYNETYSTAKLEHIVSVEDEIQHAVDLYRAGVKTALYEIYNAIDVEFDERW